MATKIQTEDISALAVTDAELAADSVITAKILNSNITTIKLADDAVTADKIATAVAGGGLTGGGGSAIAIGAAAGITVNANDIQIDQAFSPTWTGTHDFTGGTVTVATPSASGHPVTKAYADAIVSGLSDFKPSVRALVDRAGLPAYTQAGAGEGATLTANANGAFLDADSDDVTLIANDRVVVVDPAGTGHADHGIYTLTQVGDAGNPWILTRATDADGNPAAEVTPGMYCLVEEGTAYADTAWICSTNGTITVDTTAIAMVHFSSPVSTLAGDGLQKSGNTMNVDVSDFAGTGLEDDGSENLRIAAAAAGTGLTGGAGSALSVDLDEVSSVVFDPAADTMVIIDATDGSTKKDLWSDIAALVAGDGIQAASGVLAVDVSDFAGTGLEDDGSENLRLAAQGTGIAGGTGSTLSLDESYAATWTALETFSAALTVSGGALTHTGAAIDLDPTGAFTLDMDASQNATVTLSTTSDFIVADAAANTYLTVSAAGGLTQFGEHIRLVDDKAFYIGTNNDWQVSYDEAGGDALLIAAQPLAAAAGAAGAFSIAGRTGGATDGVTPAGAGGQVGLTAGVGGAADATLAAAIGGIVSGVGGIGGAGSAAQLAGVGGNVTFTGGAAGADGGGGGAAGGTVLLDGGLATGAGANGSVALGSVRAASIELGNATDDTTITQTGTGQVTFAGNVDADSGLDVAGADLTTASGLNITMAGAGLLTTGTAGITAVSGSKLTLGSTTVAAEVSSMTTAQRDALSAEDGMLIFNSTTGQFEGYDSGWQALGSGGSVTGTNSISFEINQDADTTDEDPFLQLSGGDGTTEKHGFLKWHAGNEEFELYADDNGTRVATVLNLGQSGETAVASIDAAIDFNSTTDASGAKSARITYLGQEDDLVIGTGAGAVSAVVNLDAEAGLDVTGGALTVDNQAITQTTGGQVTFAGNVDAQNGLDVTTAALTAAAGLTVSGGAVDLDPTTVAIDPTSTFALSMDASQSATFSAAGADSTNGFLFTSSIGDHNAHDVVEIGMTRTGGMLTINDEVHALQINLVGHASDVAETNIAAIDLGTDGVGSAYHIGLQILGTGFDTGIQLGDDITMEWGDDSDSVMSWLAGGTFDWDVTGALDIDVTGALSIDSVGLLTAKGAAGASFGDDVATWDFDGAGAVSETGMTSLSATPSGAITLTAGAASTWSTSAGALTLTSAAAATWSTSAGDLTLTAGGDVNVTSNLDAEAGLDVTGAALTAASGITNTAGTVLISGGDLDVDVASNFSSTLTMSGSATIAMGGSQITGLASPTLDTDAANKGYVDAAVEGLSVKDSVRVATDAAGTLATSFENGDTVDGIVLATGDRILIKNQASGIENGIYIVEATGAPTRADDMAATTEAAGVFTFVEEGTVNADSGWVCTTDDAADVVGTDALAFAQFSGAGSITAGAGMTKSGNTMNVIATDASILVAADDLGVQLDGAVGLEITASGVRIAAAAAGTGLAGGGASALSVDLNEVASVVFDPAADTMPIIDATDGSTKKDLWSDIAALIAGDGVSAAAGVLAVDHDGEGLIIDTNQLALELDGATLTKSATGVKVGDNAITATQIDETDSYAWSGTDTHTGSMDASGMAAGAFLVPSNTLTPGASEPMTWGSIYADGYKSVSAAVVENALPASTYSASKITASANGAFPTVDGVPASSDGTAGADDGSFFGSNTYLVTDQATGSENGLYYLSDPGDVSNPWVLTRAPNFDSTAELATGAFIYVAAGISYGQSIWVLDQAGAVVDTTALTFSRIDVEALTAGDGVDLTWDAENKVRTLDLDLKANGGLVIESTEVAIDLGASAITGTLAVGDGGTGAITLTDGGVLLGSGTGAVTALGQATNGQLVVGFTGADPVLATLTAGAGVDVTNGAGSITVAAADVGYSELDTATKARIGGGWDAITKDTGTGAQTAFDLGHSDVELAEEAVLVTRNGLVMEWSNDNSADFYFGNGTGAGGVDQVIFETAPANNARIIIRYRRDADL